MKRLFLMCILYFSIPCYAADINTVFLNKNKTYSLEVSYQFCNCISPDYYWKCDTVNTANIARGDLNYLIIPTPEIPIQSATQVIVVLSSIAKDQNGNIVARGTYDAGPVTAWRTSGQITEVRRYGTIINFEIEPELGIVGNYYSAYQYSGSSPYQNHSPDPTKLLSHN